MHKYSFEQAMELAYQVEPKGEVRVYFSNDVQLWFVNVFRHPHAAASAMGSSHSSSDDALQAFCESCNTQLNNRAMEAAPKPSPVKHEVKFTAIGGGPLWQANHRAREALTKALAGL